MTFDAVDSVNRLTFDGKTDIFIVCNGKQYDLTDEIKYRGYKNVFVLLLERNKGFSVGNNLGYSFAKEKNDYDFIIFINNDVLIEQKNFLIKLFEVYEKHKFYVAGPDIYTPYSDYHSSPIDVKPLGYDAVNEIINKKKKLLEKYNKRFSVDIFKLYILETCLWRDKLKGLLKVWRKLKKNNKSYRGEKENVVLQGSCIIFSHDYIDINERAFEPEVFLYFEEHYLARKCREKNWKTVYTDELQVLHYHRGSSGLLGVSYKEYCDKMKLVVQAYLKSAEDYRKNLDGRS